MARAGGGRGGTSRYRSTTTGGNITLASQSISGVTPFVQITYKVPGSGGTTVTETTTLSGTNTDTLTISCDSVKTQTVSCEIDGSSIPTIPTTVTSSTANFYSISQSNLQDSEIVSTIINDLDGSLVTSTTNLFQNNLVLTDSDSHFKSFTIYAEGNTPVRITLEGGGGKGLSASLPGGAGGRTVFDYTLLANTEYTFKLGNKDLNNVQGGDAAYFYEKAQLLVVSGGGGSASTGGAGGNGGGAGISGAPGFRGGGGGGTGGAGVLNGTLPANGLSPSGTVGGRVESCTSGYYWKTQGKAPCEDLGKVNFFTAEGTQVNNTTNNIERGYKADINYPFGFIGYRVNGGSSTFGNGGGGSGAIGGNATTNGIGGGGGGSGYTNGAVTIVSTGTALNANGGSTPFPARATIELRT